MEEVQQDAVQGRTASPARGHDLTAAPSWTHLAAAERVRGAMRNHFLRRTSLQGLGFGRSGGGTPSAGENVKARRRRRLRQSRTCSLNIHTAKEVESRERSVSQTTGAKVQREVSGGQWGLVLWNEVSHSGGDDGIISFSITSSVTDKTKELFWDDKVFMQKYCLYRDIFWY